MMIIQIRHFDHPPKRTVRSLGNYEEGLPNIYEEMRIVIFEEAVNHI
jgi:hypothetical protein